MAESHRIAGKSYRYNLVCNIVHDGQPGAGKGTYRAHVYHKGTRQWHEIQDLHVANMLPEMITLSESYIQVWERQSELDAKPGTAQAPVKMETSA